MENDMIASHQKPNVNGQRGKLVQVESALEGDAPVQVDYAKALSWRLDTFKPSDRDFFKNALSDPERAEEARFAVGIYLSEWADSDWQDDSVRRLGKWLAINANEETKQKLIALFKHNDHAVYRNFLQALVA